MCCPLIFCRNETMNRAEGPNNAKIHKRKNKKMASQKDEKEESVT
jgi:hypothetical protein